MSLALYATTLLCYHRLEAEWELENSQRVMDTYFRANTLVRYAMIIGNVVDRRFVLNKCISDNACYNSIQP